MGGVESDYRPARWGSFREDFKFTGKEEDVEIGLIYFGARYYHPKLGRFASADPLTIHAAASDLNPYAYVHGRVMSSVDPLGLQERDTACDSDCDAEVKALVSRWESGTPTAGSPGTGPVASEAGAATLEATVRRCGKERRILSFRWPKGGSE
jgi:RHS repeat-associated protein